MTDTLVDGRVREPDAQGQAALLLIESTLHALIEASILTVPQVLSAITTACDVKVEVAEENHESRSIMLDSLQMLKKIGDTIRIDLDQADSKDNSSAG